MAETPILAGLEWVETQEDCESLGWFVPVGTEMLDQSTVALLARKKRKRGGK